MRVRDIMSAPPITVAPDTTLRQLAMLLSEREISGVPVLESDQVVGIVSESDIIERERGPDEQRSGTVGFRLHHQRCGAATATTTREAMTSPPVIVEPWMSPYEAAWLMSVHDVSRLPVVDRGELIGVVSRSDLVRYFARPDIEIRSDVVEDVLVPLDTADVELEVTEGCVRLTGEVMTPADLGCLQRAVSRVPGVVAVECNVASRS